MISNKINIENILQKHGDRFKNLYINKPELKDAIKEIIESVIDKCAEDVKSKPPNEDYCHNCHGTSGYIDRESILHVKQLVIYE